MNGRFSDNADEGRFELDLAGQIAFANYRRTDDGILIFHVETPRALRGQGVAGRQTHRRGSARRGTRSDPVLQLRVRVDAAPPAKREGALRRLLARRHRLC